MRIKKIAYLPVLAILLCTSCARVDIKNYDRFELSYKDYARTTGHQYKYLKKDASKELGEKTLSLYKSILESNEKYSNLYGAEGVTEVGCYSFDFVYENSTDYILFSKDQDFIYVYNKGNRIIYRCYNSLSEDYLKEIKELKTTYESILKDSEWVYE